MADGHPAAPAKFLGLAADIFDLHALRGLGEIEVHVDFGVEIARDGKNPIDLAARIGVEIRHGADRPRAAAQALDQQFFGAGIVGEPLLRENAQFDVDRPGVIARELVDRFEPDHSNSRIKLDMGTHAHRALRDAAFQGPPAPRIDVFDGEAALGGRGFPDGFGDGAFLDAAAVEDAGLVEMDMRLDHAGDHQAALRFQFRPIRRQGRRMAAIVCPERQYRRCEARLPAECEHHE